MTTQTSHTPPLRLGMIGGGLGSFIGPVHRMAAALDGRWAFVAGALSSTSERALASSRALGLAPERSYEDWRQMLQRELARPDADRIDAVAIVAPNHAHADAAVAFARAGFHVMIDKPMTRTLAEAREVADAVRGARVVGGVCYVYTGYPMVRQAAAAVRAGALGRVRKAFVEYHQGWLSEPIEAQGQKQAAWRTDPARAGAGGVIGDIGTHAAHLLEFVTGLRIESLCADLASFVPGRRLDDDASVMLRLSDGARATLTASQVCIGEGNNLSIRVHGDAGSLWWRQESADSLVIARADGARTIHARGEPASDPRARSATRLPPGHPEGFIEAFGNLYAGFAAAIVGRRTGSESPGAIEAPPTVNDGLRGVAFVERAAASAAAGSTWVTMTNI